MSPVAIDLDALAARRCSLRVLRCLPTRGGWQAVIELLEPLKTYVAVAATPNEALAAVLAQIAPAPTTGGVFD